MQVGDICSRDVYSVKREEPLADAARELLKRHIGALVVVERRGEATVPIGIVTDRDVVCGQIERKADLFCLTVEDVMTNNPLTIEETCDVPEAIRHLSARGVRRAPVVSERFDLVGIVSLDDLLPAVAEELGALAGLMGTQARDEGAAHAPVRT